MKYKWIGRTGTNKFFGYVEEGKIFDNLSELDIKFGLDYKLLELVEEENKSKKGKKKFTDMTSCY